MHVDNSSDDQTRIDDSDADAFAVLSLLVIAAAAFVYWLNH
jgi:hypothetical protein